MTRRWVLMAVGDGWDYADELDRFYTRWGARCAARRLNASFGGPIPLRFEVRQVQSAPASPLSGAVVAAAPGALAPVEPRHDPEVTT